MLLEYNKDLFIRYFQKNSDYYINQMENYIETGKYTFSISAFFLGIFWMAYRKMYIHILIICALIFAQSFIFLLLLNLNIISQDIYDVIDKLSILGWGIVIGLISNRLYLIKSEKVIKKILEENSNEELINVLILKKGGITWFAPIVLLFLVVLIILVGS